MRGELDWIVMKALEKDRTRRYETATSLGQEMTRYLEGDAVEVTFGSRDRMKEIFLEARVDGQLIHEVSLEVGKVVKPSRLALAIVLGGLAGMAAGYLIGTLLGGS